MSHLMLQNIADDLSLLYAGKRDQVAILKALHIAGKTKRPLADIQAIEKKLPSLHRAALAMQAMVEARENVPQWILDLFEGGADQR